jgi:hypothetical protein
MTRQQLGLTMGQKPAIVLWITVDEQEHTYNKLEISHTSVVPRHSSLALSGRVSGCEQQDRGVENAAETSAARQRLSPPELPVPGPQPRS